VNINTLGFSPFAFPTDMIAAILNYQWPQVIPYGEDTATAESLGVQILGDSVNDQGFTGFILPAGLTSPGGQAGDTLMWYAGTSQPLAAGLNPLSINFPATF
jgi:hypothetical protein